MEGKVLLHKIPSSVKDYLQQNYTRDQRLGYNFCKRQKMNMEWLKTKSTASCLLSFWMVEIKFRFLHGVTHLWNFTLLDRCINKTKHMAWPGQASPEATLDLSRGQGLVYTLLWNIHQKEKGSIKIFNYIIGSIQAKSFPVNLFPVLQMYLICPKQCTVIEKISFQYSLTL